MMVRQTPQAENSKLFAFRHLNMAKTDTIFLSD